MLDQLISELDDPLMRAIINVKPVSSKSIRNYILSLVPLDENAKKHILPDQFCVMFDWWTDTKTQFVAVSATYLTEENYHETVLACALLLKEDELTTTQPCEFLFETVNIFSKYESNIACFVDKTFSLNLLFRGKQTYLL